MHTYKPGDKVRILEAMSFGGADLSDDYTVGDICEVKGGTDRAGDTLVYTKDRSTYRYFAQGAIEPVVKTWDTLSEGDVLVKDNVDYERIVQGVIGKIVFTVDTDGIPRYNSIDELKESGWKIKGAEEPEELVEITLEEIAKLKGVSVEKIRVKE